MTTFELSPDLQLPDTAMTETIAFLASKGYGKTYAAMLLAEQMLVAGGQVVAIDPTGKWWALRLAANGKDQWSDIPIFGGNFGDLPLPPTSGEMIADLIVEHSVSAVLDVSTLLEGEKARFVGDFLSKLKTLKARQVEPPVLHLFWEEAQDIIPEGKGAGGEKSPALSKMKGSAVRIVRQGRNWGIGVTMISQRPQSLAKEALNMTSMLVVGNMRGPHERKAIKGWIQEQGKEDEAAAQLEKLPTLRQGEFVVWSPGWLGVLDVVRLNKKETFDASATPKLGMKLKNVSAPKPIDIAGLREALESAEVHVKENDPSELKKEVKELRKQLAEKKTPEPPKIDTFQLRSLTALIDEAGTKLVQFADQALSLAGNLRGEGQDILRRRSEIYSSDLPRKALLPPSRASKPPPPAAARAPREVPTKAPANGEQLVGKMTPMIRYIIGAGDEGYHPRKLAVLVAMQYGAGGFSNYLRDLKNLGLAEMKDGKLVATADAAKKFTPLQHPTSEELLALWSSQLVGKSRDILRYLHDNYPKAYSRKTIGGVVNMSSEAGGFSNYMRDMKKAGLISTDRGGQWSAADDLFPPK